MSIEKKFEEIKTIRFSIKNTFKTLTEKHTEIKDQYKKYIESNKKSELLDSFYFQIKIMDYEYENTEKLYHYIDNRMYCDYYKLFIIVYNYFKAQFKEEKSEMIIKNSKYPVYKDLDQLKKYDFDTVNDIHQDIIRLIEYVTKIINQNTEEIKIHQIKVNNGLNIDNYIFNLEYNNNLIINNVSLYRKYLSAYHKYHSSFLSNLNSKLNLILEQLKNDVNFTEPIKTPPQILVKMCIQCSVKEADYCKKCMNEEKDEYERFNILRDSIQYSEHLNNDEEFELVNKDETNNDTVIKDNLVNEIVIEVPVINKEVVVNEEVVINKEIKEEPVIEEQVVVNEEIKEEPVIEEQVVVNEEIKEEPVIEESVKEEEDEQIVVNEKIKEEPIIEEQVVVNKEIKEEPVIEESVKEEEDEQIIVNEEIKEDPVIEDPVIEEEPVVEEAIKEEKPVIEESVIEEPVIEESVKQEIVIEEPLVVNEELKEEPIVEEIKQEPLIEEIKEEPLIKEVKEEALVEELLVEEAKEEQVVEEVKENSIIEEAKEEIKEEFINTIVHESSIINEEVIQEYPSPIQLSTIYEQNVSNESMDIKIDNTVNTDNIEQKIKKTPPFFIDLELKLENELSHPHQKRNKKNKKGNKK
jgi:hypothetical protein